MTFAVIGWLAIIAAWGVWEVLGLRKAEDSWPTFTFLVRRYVPKWITAALLGWLFYHFLIET